MFSALYLYVYIWFMSDIYENVDRTKQSGKLFETAFSLLTLYRFSFSVTRNLSNLACISESYPAGYFDSSSLLTELQILKAYGMLMSSQPSNSA